MCDDIRETYALDFLSHLGFDYVWNGGKVFVVNMTNKRKA